MTFNEIYPDFETFKTKINDVFEDTVQTTDEIFYVFIKNQFGKRIFLSADENFIQSKIFENWQILKQKWVKLLEINESSVAEILKQQTETETYKGNLTEIGSETKKFLDTGGSSNFTPAVITAIGRVIDLPNIYKSIGNLFQTLFFNIRVKINGSSSTPKVEYTSELELANPQKESFPRADKTYPTFQNEVNEIFKKEIQELIDGGGGSVLPEKLSWLDAQLETLPNTTEEVFLNAVFIFYIKNGEKLFLATTILMLLDEVDTNSNNIAGNTSDIVDLEGNVAGLVSQLNGLGNRLTAAESDISDNETLITDIKTKTDNIFFLDGLKEKDVFDRFKNDSNRGKYIFMIGGRRFHFSLDTGNTLIFLSSDFRNFGDKNDGFINYLQSLVSINSEDSIESSVSRSYQTLSDSFVLLSYSNPFYENFNNLGAFANYIANKLFPAKTPILDFWNNTPLTVIDDNEASNFRYTFSNFSTPRWDLGGEYGFTFSAVLSKNSQIGDDSVVGLQSLFNFKNATLNAWKFVPVVHLTSPTGRVYVLHSAYKTGSLNYHYVHVYLGGLPTSGDKLDAELGTWIVHFKLYHTQTLPQTRQIQTKNVKSKEDLFFEKMKADYEKAKKMEAKNAKSRLN